MAWNSIHFGRAAAAGGSHHSLSHSEICIRDVEAQAIEGLNYRRPKLRVLQAAGVQRGN
jgi:hypothetical protein